MQLNISQQMKMSQQMKLAPRMIQSMEILQLPLMALEERIDQEMEENPVLERGDDDVDISDTEVAQEIEKAHEEATATAVDEKELVVDTDHNNEADFERLLEMSADWPEDNLSAGSRVSSNRVQDDSDRHHDVIANMVARPQSLQEYLLEQFGFFSCSPQIRSFGEYLIQNLDHNGRLQSSLAEVTEVYGRLIDRADAERALDLVRKLDPPGVGARDLKECLLLQLTKTTPYRDALRVLISSHLEDIAANRLPVIERKTGYPLELIKAAIEQLHHLNPVPGQEFETQPVQKITPDLSVDKDDTGKYIVKLKDEYTPQLRISRYYVEQLRNSPDAKTKEYIRGKIDSAKWLIDSIEQRQNTIRRVAQAIVDHQTEFLDRGPEFLTPLKMQQIADIVSVHVTTVSRAVDKKWIETPRGLFSLKSFFGGGTRTADGEEVAWNIVRLKMKDLVDNEDKRHPLSDDALVEKLAVFGYTLARRTITKYRKALGIPSSRQRREY